MFKRVDIPEPFKSSDALYAHLEIGKGEAKFLKTGSSQRYRQIEIPKRREGTRVLLAPDKRLKYHQRLILNLLESMLVVRDPVHGFVKRRGQITNANAHQGRPYLLNFDLRNFFPSINVRRVQAMLSRLGVPSDTIEILIALTMTQNQLPQGAPTSPILSNMICFRMDRQLMQFAHQHHIRYTRYADDISFSSYRPPSELFESTLPTTGPVATDRLATPLRNIVDRNGFEIHSEKTWFADKRGRKDVTGLTVNEFTNIPRKYIRNLRASLYKVETMGLAAAQAEFRSKYNSKATLEAVLRGRLLWVAQVRGYSFSAYRTLANRYNQIFPNVPLRIDAAADDLIDRATWVIEWSADTKTGFAGEQGTAVFVRGVGLVTANHVVKDLADDARAEIFHPGMPTKKYKAWKSGKSCERRDLCVLHHKIPPNNWLTLPLSSANDRQGDQVSACGFPAYDLGSGLSRFSGEIVNRYSRHGVQLVDISAVINSGMSGGPVLNAKTEIVGFGIRGGHTESRQTAVAGSELVALLSAKL